MKTIKTIIHVNQHNIKANNKGEKRAVLKCGLKHTERWKQNECK